MKLLSLLLVVALVSVSFADEDVDESDVLVLNNDNFDSEIAKNPLILVEFYAPWCGHCKRLKPEYAKAATELKQFNIPIAKVDADAESNKALASKYGVRGFPTIKLFRDGKAVSDYQGDRSVNAIVSFMKKQNLPAISTLDSVEAVEKFAAEDKVVIVGFFDDKESSHYKTYAKTAEKLRDSFLFGEVIGNADVNQKFEVTKTPFVILFKQFDEKKNTLSGDAFHELEEFIAKSSVPLIDEIGPQNFKTYMDSGLPLGYIFVDPSVAGQFDDYVARIKPIAQETKGALNWVWIDWGKYAKHSERLGLSGTKVPAVAIEKITEGSHWAYDESAEISTEKVKEWVASFLSGTLPQTVKSEEIPANNDGPVKIVVAKNFDTIVDRKKDVLLEFYAPWCGHCKKLAPVYEELGTAFASIDSVVIAKMDATANDVDPKYNVRGFPTLKFFPANSETIIDYEGDRSFEDMATFIKEHATNKFELDIPQKEKSGDKDEL